MKLGRITVGIIAGLVGAIFTVAFYAWEYKSQLLLNRRAHMAIFLGVACAVFWLAERLDVVASAYRRPIFDLHETDDDDNGVPRTPTTAAKFTVVLGVAPLRGRKRGPEGDEARAPVYMPHLLNRRSALRA